MRNLVLVLGDQLSTSSAAFDGFDKKQDTVWMAEVDEELTHVWCHKLRIAFFLSAMRHFRDQLKQDGYTISYHEITADRTHDAGPDFCSVLKRAVHRLKPRRLIVVEPGDYRVKTALENCAKELELPLDIVPDRHFYCGTEEFAGYAEGKNLILENFYRHMRKKHCILMEGPNQPAGGQWNYDEQNREPLPAELARVILTPKQFEPDAITQQVLDLVAKRYADHPGSLANFTLPVTAADAGKMLRHFVQHRLALFGPYEDAMAVGQPFIYHSRLSALLNVKLLDPRTCVQAAVEAYEDGRAALNSVEGFVRQILGWREFMRGVYWLKMPGYIENNFLEHKLPVPHFFWDGETDMHCIRETMQGILANGYAHHIQRLMVMGLFAQLYGVHPRRFHDWHMALYIDAIDWVSLPNTLGMSQYGDGGIVGTKPYCASGNYINKMSNYCHGCRYDPKAATGENACPFTTLYYDFLDRHYEKFKNNARLKFQLMNIDRKRKDAHVMQHIRQRAAELHEQWEAPAARP
jgi:(6-4)DNA photolyase